MTHYTLSDTTIAAIKRLCRAGYSNERVRRELGCGIESVRKHRPHETLTGRQTVLSQDGQPETRAGSGKPKRAGEDSAATRLLGEALEGAVRPRMLPEWAIDQLDARFRGFGVQLDQIEKASHAPHSLSSLASIEW